MAIPYLVRFGSVGHIGRFRSADMTSYSRRSRVVCRTKRGLEIGEVLSSESAVANDPPRWDGEIVRPMTIQDELLCTRLEKNRLSAMSACEAMLASRCLPITLIDVEHLFDGQSLFFYFLGEVTTELESLTHQLAETYEAEVQFRKFTATLTDGCGPDCGSDDGQIGCSANGCSSCLIAQACGARRSG